jgi:hypothetical protein
MDAQSSNEATIGPINGKTGAGCKQLAKMRVTKLTIVFHWSTDARSDNELGIGPINAKNSLRMPGVKSVVETLQSSGVRAHSDGCVLSNVVDVMEELYKQ